MAGFDHGPAESHEGEQAHTITRNARQGLRLFAIYFFFYAGFVVLNAFRPDWTEATPLAGINVAVLYGFALILGALIMSLVYGWLCHGPAAGDAGDSLGGNWTPPSVDRKGDGE
jgi:uncharacterized membrane protein (DUF485 family)